jgi:EmrB/QacA subfamily drug resistance transporter
MGQYVATPLGIAVRRLLHEPRRPAAIRDSPRAPRYVVGTVCIGAFMGQLDVSIVTLALPHIGADLHVGTGAVQWVALSYLLMLTGTLAAVGQLADRFGRKLLYTYGFAVFTVGSVLCGLAPNLGLLIAARLLQGFGAALLQANSVALIAATLPRRQLARGIGVQGAAQAIGLALGPVLGGLLLALGGWRLIFLVNLPAGLLGLVLGRLLLPRTRFAPAHRTARFDRSGAALLAAALAALMLLISLAHELLRRPAAGVALAALTAALLCGLLARERRASAPLLDLQLLRRPALALGLGSAAAAYLVMFGALYVVPYYLAADHIPVALAGLQLAALPVALGILAPLTGRLAGRIDARRGAGSGGGAGPAGGLGVRALTGGGLLLTALGLLVLAASHDVAGRLVGLALAGAGLGAFIPANNAGVMSAASRARAGALSGILNTTRGLGTALGVALASLLYTAVVRSAGVTATGSSGAALAAAGHGLNVTLIVLAGVALGTAALLLLARPSTPPADESEPRDAEDRATRAGAAAVGRDARSSIA